MHWIKPPLIALFTLFICCSFHLSAVPVSESPSAKNSVTVDPKKLAKQRKTFLKAEYAARQRKSRDYKMLYNQLDGYPLQPYIEFGYLKKHLYWKNRHKIRDFLTRFAGTPMEWPLRKKWLKYLSKLDKQQDFISDYQPSSDTSLHCYHLRYLLANGEPETRIFSQVDELWVYKKSQPKACDPLFKLWEKAGWRSNDKIWQRMVLAANGGDHTLIPYLKRLTPVDEQYLADLWYKTRRDPRTVSKLKRFPNKNVKEQQILLYGIKRLVWRDKKLALSSWQKIQQKFDFSAAQKTDVAKTFAIRLAQAGHDKAPQWLEKIPTNDVTNDIVQWRIADSLRRNQWHDALDVLQSLPEHLSKKEIWSYWLARSLEKTGALDDAHKFYKKVALERHYYGFMAASMIGQQPNLADVPLVFSDAEIQSVTDTPAAQRALEFRHFKRYSQARREWNYFNRKLNAREQMAAAKWANQNDWFDRAIFTLAQHKYWDDVNLRFPLAYKETLSYHSNRNKLEPSLAFAIARRESSFMSDANSSAGALGLMQMLPSTARFIAKKKINRSKLFSANTNVRYATDYLKYLLKNVDGNEVVAAAAYNAGITRVRRWLKTKEPMPVDIWIETIPYKETREYVKSVMAYRQIYSNLLGNQENKFKHLATMQIGL